ncbi:MAG: purine-nucleoside phosphorylase [Eubacterium sp.]
MDCKEKLNKSYNYIKSNIDFEPEIGLVLGSGCGNFADMITNKKTIKYSDIEGFPVSTVSGHDGILVFGYIGDVAVVAMQGRVHYYEGYSMQEVVHPIRVICMLGIKCLILTNAAGGINKSFNPGDLMLITDHISSFVPSPLVGNNIDALGTRFPDMSHVYNDRLNNIIRQTAEKLELHIKQGVYLQAMGPNYETPAEINMYALLGADAVGMSTACEATAANHSGTKICGISCITNMAAGISAKALCHEEVKETAQKVTQDFCKLLYESIIQIGESL